MNFYISNCGDLQSLQLLRMTGAPSLSAQDGIVRYWAISEKATGGEAMLSDQSEIRRSKPAGLIMLVGLTMLLTAMERTMADSAVTHRVLQVEHIR